MNRFEVKFGACKAFGPSNVVSRSAAHALRKKPEILSNDYVISISSLEFNEFFKQTVCQI